MEEFLEKHKIKDERIAVAVSGGADSLALALQASEELAPFGRKVVALTVDHRLRPSSGREAQYVAELMKAHNIEHHILEWQGDKPQTGVEEEARRARYALLFDWCCAHKVRILMTAHHLDDQAETFLMRLQRGSGLEGLCCIREVVNCGDVLVARPLLKVKPARLKDYLKARKISWIEDESNTDGRYLRNRIRQYLPEFTEKTGITKERIVQTVANLQSVESFVCEQVSHIMQQCVRQDFANIASFRYTDYLSWHPEVKFRILATLCRKNYIPRADRVLKLIERLNRLPFKGATLGDKAIVWANGVVWVAPEITSKQVESRKNWENFLQQNPQYKGVKVPHKVRLGILQQSSAKDDL